MSEQENETPREEERPLDPSDPKDARKIALEAKRRRVEYLDVIRAVMGLKQGRRFIGELLSWCHVRGSSFNPDPIKMAFAEGERNIGLRLEADLIEASPEHYLEFLREHGDTNA